MLRDPAARDALLAELGGADRLVLLGDALELRHGPVPTRSRPRARRSAAIGEALGDRTARSCSSRATTTTRSSRRGSSAARSRGEPPLGLEQRADPTATTLAGVARRAGSAPARSTLAYPGLWLRDDVYATHGHYLDRHVTVPTFERLAAGAMARVVGEMPARRRRARGLRGRARAAVRVAARRLALHEARLRAPEGHAERLAAADRLRPAAAARPRARRRLPDGRPRAEHDGRRPGGRRPVAGRAAPRRACGRCARRAAGSASTRGLGALRPHAPRGAARRRRRRRSGRPRRRGPRLVNTGCWVHEKVFLGDGGERSPYWPGTVVEVGDDGPPVLRNVLAGYRPDVRASRRGRGRDACAPGAACA